MEEVFHVKSSDGEVLRVYNDHVVIARDGVLGVLSRGTTGERTIMFSQVSSVQFKKCGWTPGFLEFTFAGSSPQGKTATAFDGINNENRFSFTRPTLGAAKKLAAEMEEVLAFIQQKVAECHSGVVVNQASQSPADEIIKYKGLLDAGIITQEEFEVKKRQLLNL